ncbi:tyrosine-type recombinase/integrase [Candidatus Nephthysia bennettiae]|uniref:Tyrosine-type recombinase/integrase n=1 Tax=Candidatus Nephthysia bennettiae TaxID=3127016 RepID=A0A934K515_9BACT|nr:tyrosine-type recombinase/integrase [Candidatus Dormibacteraeota bacterium]
MTTAAVAVDFGRELPLQAAARSFRHHLKAENRSPHTITTYLTSIDLFRRHLEDQGLPREVGSVRREHVEAFLIGLFEKGAKPATASTYYRGLRSFFGWLVKEEELLRSPLAGMSAPSVPEVAVPVVSDEEMKRLLASIERERDFAARRDSAMIRTFVDSGLRLRELTNLLVEDVDFDAGTVRVRHGKGGRERRAGVGDRTLRALDRYLRLRHGHPKAAEPWLWLGKSGHLGAGGAHQIVRRRGQQAGLPGLHAHLFRHTFAHQMKAAGASVEDLMSLGGWRSPQVLARYGASVASERAVAVHHRLSPGDRI